MKCFFCKKALRQSDVPKAVTTYRWPDGSEHSYGVHVPVDPAVVGPPKGVLRWMAHHQCFWNDYRKRTRPRHDSAQVGGLSDR